MSRTKSVLDIGLLPSKGGALNRVEATKVNASLLESDLSAPFLRAPIPHDACNAGRIVTRQTQIFHVRRWTSFVNVFPTVIATNAVFVVDFFSGPFTCLYQPRHPVREILASKYRALSVALVCFCRERFSISVACIPALPLGLRAEVMDRPPLPKQTPGFGVIGEKSADLFRCQLRSI